jgi:hypothetical protein
MMAHLSNNIEPESSHTDKKKTERHTYIKLD